MTPRHKSDFSFNENTESKKDLVGNVSLITRIRFSSKSVECIVKYLA